MKKTTLCVFFFFFLAKQMNVDSFYYFMCALIGLFPILLALLDPADASAMDGVQAMAVMSKLREYYSQASFVLS